MSAADAMILGTKCWVLRAERCCIYCPKEQFQEMLCCFITVVTVTQAAVTNTWHLLPCMACAGLLDCRGLQRRNCTW
jgi:hypothetical protein